MLSRFFCSRIRVILLILFIVEFFHFQLFLQVFGSITNYKLFLIIVLFLFIWFFDNRKTCIKAKYIKKFNLLMAFLIFFVFLNCISCLYFRDQAISETLYNWSPVLLLFLFYPFYSFNIRIKDWETILLSIFIINLFIHVLITIIPEVRSLIQVEVSDAKFEMEMRARLFSDAILLLGHLFCFNMLLIGKRRLRYSILFFISFIAIFLLGFRTIILADMVVCFYMFIKIKGFSLKYCIISSLIVFLSLVAISTIDYVQFRYNEIIERNEEANFNNDDYVRVLLIDYYYSSYFKNNIEMVLGSGMVRRIYRDSRDNAVYKEVYPSDYSKFVSYNSQRYHFFPVDMGLIGLSWEAGIPVVIILILLCLLLIIPTNSPRYLYIRGWGAFLILISAISPYYYYHKNMIYTVIMFVIFMKLPSNSSIINNRRLKISNNEKE